MLGQWLTFPVFFPSWLRQGGRLNKVPISLQYLVPLDCVQPGESPSFLLPSRVDSFSSFWGIAWKFINICPCFACVLVPLLVVSLAPSLLVRKITHSQLAVKTPKPTAVWQETQRTFPSAAPHFIISDTQSSVPFEKGSLEVSIPRSFTEQLR